MQAKSEALPPDFVARVEADFPRGLAAEILEGLRADRRTSFRLNSLHPDAAAAPESLLAAGIEFEPIDGRSDAFSVAPAMRQPLLESDPARSNRIYIQNASSQLPPLILDPRSGERILDLAAAPGSKTLQIAALMQNQGEIAAVELVRSRFYRMNALLKQYGATCVRTFLKNGMDVWRHRPEHFDRVLLDAPCASEGRFSAGDPDSYAFWTPRKVAEMVRKQRRLLFSAVQSLRPDGVLVYSTCSLSLDENEGVLTDVMEQFDGALEAEPFALSADASRPPQSASSARQFAPSLSNARRIVPDDLHEGFFVCRLRKTRSTVDARYS